MKTKLVLSILLLTLFFCFEKGMAQTPGYVWAKSVSGNRTELPFGIATDVNGNIYITGYFTSDSITFGNTTLINSDNGNTSDIFIAKYDGSGNVLWAKSIGSMYYNEICYNIVLDANGNLVITGKFEGPSITFDSITLTNAGDYDIFIAKYDTAGNVLWAKSIGGSDTDIACSVAADGNGNSYLTGNFSSANIAFDSITLSLAGIADVFIVKYDSSGNAIWAKSSGGPAFSASVGGRSIALDSGRNSYLTGNFVGTVTFDSTTLVSTGGSDIFVAKYDEFGNFLWAKSATGNHDDYNSYNSITTDHFGNLYITGVFKSDTITFDSLILINTSSGVIPPLKDIFIVKYNPYGNVIWAKAIGGAEDEAGMVIITDANGDVIITGNFNSPTITIGNVTLTKTGTSDFFVAKYDPFGNIIWAENPYNDSYASAFGLTINPMGELIVTGNFHDTINFGSIVLINPSGLYSDIFIAKLDNITGFAEQTPINNLDLYPNPATDYLTINTNSNKKQVITITDITGKIIYSTTTLSDKTIINTKDFPQGVYSVQVQAGDAVETRKVVITR